MKKQRMNAGFKVITPLCIGASMAVIMLITFVINLRHVLYRAF